MSVMTLAAMILAIIEALLIFFPSWVKAGDGLFSFNLTVPGMLNLGTSAIGGYMGGWGTLCTLAGVLGVIAAIALIALVVYYFMKQTGMNYLFIAFIVAAVVALAVIIVVMSTNSGGALTPTIWVWLALIVGVLGAVACWLGK